MILHCVIHQVQCCLISKFSCAPEMPGVGTDIGGYQLENEQVDHGILSLPVISVSTNNEMKLE